MEEALYVQINDRLTRIEEKIDAFMEFRAQSMAKEKWASVIISGVIGFVSVITSGVLTCILVAKITH